jgi:hypothetical protein
MEVVVLVMEGQSPSTPSDAAFLDVAWCMWQIQSLAHHQV